MKKHAFGYPGGCLDPLGHAGSMFFMNFLDFVVICPSFLALLATLSGALGPKCSTLDPK